MKTFLSYTGRFVVGVTNARTGKSEYLNGLIDDNRFAASRATCAMPLLFPSIRINGQKYYDGGVADPIPAQKALSDEMCIRDRPIIFSASVPYSAPYRSS